MKRIKPAKNKTKLDMKDENLLLGSSEVAYSCETKTPKKMT